MRYQAAAAARLLVRPALGAAAAAALLLGTPGCERAFARQRIEMRESGMANTLHVCEESERSRPARLQTAAEFIDRDLREDAVALERDGHYIREWADFDVQRFRERQPVYQQKGGELFWGKPENVERHAIILFF